MTTNNKQQTKERGDEMNYGFLLCDDGTLIRIDTIVGVYQKNGEWQVECNNGGRECSYYGINNNTYKRLLRDLHLVFDD